MSEPPPASGQTRSAARRRWLGSGAGPWRFAFHVGLVPAVLFGCVLELRASLGDVSRFAVWCWLVAVGGGVLLWWGHVRIRDWCRVLVVGLAAALLLAWLVGDVDLGRMDAAAWGAVAALAIVVSAPASFVVSLVTRDLRGLPARMRRGPGPSNHP